MVLRGPVAGGGWNLFPAVAKSSVAKAVARILPESGGAFFSWSIMRMSLPRELGRDPLDPGRDPGRDARDPGRDPAELLF